MKTQKAKLSFVKQTISKLQAGKITGGEPLTDASYCCKGSKRETCLSYNDRTCDDPRYPDANIANNQ